jgi:hypothetical protein
MPGTSIPVIYDSSRCTSGESRNPFLEPKDKIGWLRRLIDRGEIGKVLQLD